MFKRYTAVEIHGHVSLFLMLKLNFQFSFISSLLSSPFLFLWLVTPRCSITRISSREHGSIIKGLARETTLYCCCVPNTARSQDSQLFTFCAASHMIWTRMVFSLAEKRGWGYVPSLKSQGRQMLLKFFLGKGLSS